MFAQSADTCWFTLFNTQGGKGIIMKTENGGQTWKRKAATIFSDATSYPNFIYFFDTKNGVTQGDPLNGYFEIYTTTDGGENWVRTPKSQLPNPLANEIGVATVMEAKGDTIWFGTTRGRIFRSVDKGYNWTVSTTPYNNGSFIYMDDITFKDALNGFATEGDPRTLTPIIFTADGGNTWQRMATDSLKIANLNIKEGLRYIPGSGSHFMLSSRTGVAYSKDDCKTWEILDEGKRYQKVRFLNPTVGFVGSTGAVVYRWKSIASAVKDLRSEISFELYPSPANDFAQVRLTAATSGQYLLQLSDAAGRNLQYFILKGSNNYVHTLHLADLPTGVYIVTLSYANTRTSKWLIKQ